MPQGRQGAEGDLGPLADDGLRGAEPGAGTDAAAIKTRATGSTAARKLTDLNAEILAGKQIAEVESFTFVSNDNKFEVEAFLTKPLGMTATSKHPLIVNIHVPRQLLAFG